MENQDIKQKVQEFLKTRPVGVLSTVSPDGTPYSTTIYFTVDSNLNAYFLSKAQTKKIKNIRDNESVILVSFDAKSQTNVQISGKAIEIKDEPTSKEVFHDIINITREVSQTDVPPVSKLFAGHYVVYKIEPKLINYSVYNNKELEMAIFETIEF